MIRAERLAWLLIGVLLTAAALASCGGSSSSGGHPADDDTAPDDDSSPADDDASPDDDDDASPWPNLSDTLGAGEVRAGVIKSDDELIGGFRARGEIGDYKMYNSRVRFIIRGLTNSPIGWFPYSGNLIDADRCRPKGAPGLDGLWCDEQLVGLIRGFLPKSIEVVSDGHDQPAIIRVTGKDAGVDIIDHVVIEPDYGLTITTEYALDPDTDYLVMTTTLHNNHNYPRTMLIADAPLWGDEELIFTPMMGFNVDDPYLLYGMRWVAGVSRAHQTLSYALATATPDRSLFVPYIPKATSDGQNAKLLPIIEGALQIAPNGDASYKRLFFVGTGDTASIQAMINAYDNNTAYGMIEGQLQLQTGDDPSGDVDIVVQDIVRPAGDNFVGVARPDSTGKFSMQLPGGLYKLTASGAGRPAVAPVSAGVTNGKTTDSSITISPPGRFSFTATDGKGAAVPAKLSFQQGHGASPNAQVVNRFWTDATGHWTDVIAPGNYTVTASRGYEYEIDAQDVTIVAGQTTPINASIARVVNTAGYMNGDFHIHSELSVDAAARVGERVRAFMGEGLEMPINTEHDFMADYLPYVQEASGQGWVHPVRGAEISPVEAHFNTWPLTPPAGSADYFAIRFSTYDADGNVTKKRIYPDMWKIARDQFGAQIVQINHPRSDTSGWFNTVHYDPTIGISSADPALWNSNFDNLEVWNSGWNGDDLKTFIDWFSLLDQGLNYTMTGGSDSHAPGVPLGDPRNYFAMPTDDPETADPADMITSLHAHNSEVCNGPFITFTINSQPMGSLITGVVDHTVDLNITVQAPSWVQVDYLKVYSNHGAVVSQQALSGTDVVRYQGSIPMTSDTDAYFVVEVGSDTATLSPVNPGGHVFAVTNPIWVDFDGNGHFDAPGLPPPGAAEPPPH